MERGIEIDNDRGRQRRDSEIEIPVPREMKIGRDSRYERSPGGEAAPWVFSQSVEGVEILRRKNRF